MTDALLVVSFGGPEGPDEVLPFLRNVTRGRGVPEERLELVAQHYLRFGGVSPLNAQNRRMVAALRAEIAAEGLDLPVYWGNRNWPPTLGEAVRAMRDDGITRAYAFATSAYASYSGCRQYRENLAAARAEVGAGAPEIDKIRHYFDHPGFIGPWVDAVVDALSGLDGDAALVFTTHSLPESLAATSGPDGGAYVSEHQAVADLVAAGVAAATGVDHRHSLVYQSRSGPPSQPWLEPDVLDHLDALAADGVRSVVLAPVGFVSDHFEVVWDLGEEASERAASLGMEVRLAQAPGTRPDPRFVAMVLELVRERREQAPRRALSRLGPAWDVCVAGCCPNPRGPLPSVAELPGSLAR